MDQPPIMYIFINSDLNMHKGKCCAQVAHIVQKMTEELIRSAYEKFPPTDTYKTYMKWNSNCVTIILKGTTEQLNELKKMPEARHFTDYGELTVVGFFPSSNMSELVKGYKLL